MVRTPAPSAIPGLVARVVLLGVTAAWPVSASESRSTGQGTGDPHGWDPTVIVLVLRPALEYERIENEAPLAPEDYEGFAIAAHLKDAATRAVQASGLRLVPDPTWQGEAAGIAEELAAISRELLRQPPRSGARTALARAAALGDNVAVLTQALRVKVGPRGTWDAWSGAITSGSSSFRLQAALISCRSGKVLWKGEAFERAVPKAGNARFTKTTGQLFATLRAGKE